jgi:hypothetical protein
MSPVAIRKPLFKASAGPASPSQIVREPRRVLPIASMLISVADHPDDQFEIWIACNGARRSPLREQALIERHDDADP